MADYTQPPARCVEIQLQEDGSVVRCIHYADRYSVFCPAHIPILHKDIGDAKDMIERLTKKLVCFQTCMKSSSVQEKQNCLHEYFELKREFEANFCDMESRICDLRS
jgi:hypothetical protein